MNLFRPLELDGAIAEMIALYRTKTKYKPVLVVSAPIERDQAELLNADHLFTATGNPREFEGTYKITGDLPGAAIAIEGKGAAVTITTEKVSSVALFHGEDGEMRVRLRCHLPDDRSIYDQVGALAEECRADGFDFKVTDAQGVLGGENTQPKDAGEARPQRSDDDDYAKPDDNGLYDEGKAIRRPFDSGRGLVKGAILTLGVEGGFISGWQLTARLKARDLIAGDVLSQRSTVYAAESEAREAAVRDVWAIIHADSVIVQAGKESKAMGELKAYLIDLVPALATEQSGIVLEEEPVNG